MKGRIAWALTLIVVACAVNSGVKSGDDKAPPPVKPQLTVNHTLHADNGLECADCHDPEGKGEPVPAKAEFCFECHDDLENDTDKVKEYFAASKSGEEYVWPGAKVREDDLIFSHVSHMGSYEAKCSDCHGEPAATAFVRRAPLAMKATCIDCHQERAKEFLACATCHTETRKDKKPKSHDDRFQATHGANAPPAWQQGDNISWRDPAGGTCALCHAVPNACNDCHQSVKPKTHAEAGFRVGHGKLYMDAGVVPFEDSSCSLCHEENSCVRCHQTTKPRNHTLAWQRRFHGITASVDREVCMVCHKQQFCTRCHQTVKPISHRGTFARGTHSHCIACHEPLTATGCYTCHKNTRGHLSAPPLPPGPPHAGATDCRTCHRVLRHFDDGLSCRRCHR
ncbi:MAG: cytochrome c3 family protein [Planctomycetota bacterium]